MSTRCTKCGAPPPDQALRPLLVALHETINSLGRDGANADINHPHRKSWELCRNAVDNYLKLVAFDDDAQP